MLECLRASNFCIFNRRRSQGPRQDHEGTGARGAGIAERPGTHHVAVTATSNRGNCWRGDVVKHRSPGAVSRETSSSTCARPRPSSVALVGCLDGGLPSRHPDGVGPWSRSCGTVDGEDHDPVSTPGVYFFRHGHTSPRAPWLKISGLRRHPARRGRLGGLWAFYIGTVAGWCHRLETQTKFCSQMRCV
ncbi:hypothetical protein MRX96_014721 [Rhipicephalus microplus]